MKSIKVKFKPMTGAEMRAHYAAEEQRGEAAMALPEVSAAMQVLVDAGLDRATINTLFKKTKRSAK